MKNLIIILIVLISISCNNKNNLSDAYGNFETDEIIISSEANGKLLIFNLEEGQKLNKNDVIGLIDTTQFYLKKEQVIAQLGLLMAKYSGVQAQIEVQEKQKENLLKELNRIENLLQDGAATSKQMDELTNQIELTEKQINASRTQFLSINKEKQLLYVQLKQIQDQLDKCIIVNPVKGTVLEKYIETGELATIGKNMYKLADLDNMKLRVYISGEQLPFVKIGQVVKVLIDKDAKNNRELSGAISWISSSAEFTPKIIQTKKERVNLVYAVIVRVKNDGSLKIGMPGEVVFYK